MVKTCFCKTTSWKGKWVIGLKVGKSYLITQSVDYEMDELISLIRTKQEYLKKYKELSYPIVIIGGYKEKIDRYDFKEIELLFELDKAKSKYQLNSNEEIIKLIYVKKGFYSLDFQNYFKNDSPTNKEFDLKQVFLLINNFKYLKLEFNHELMNPELIPFPNVEKQQFSSLVSIIKYNYKSFKYIAKNRKLLYQKHQLVTEAIYYHQLKYMDLVITLILNSIVVYFVIYFISLNKYRIGRKICSLIQRFTVENIKELIGWLQGEPAGLKLNSGLTKFLGQLFLCVIYPFIELSDIWPSYINFLLNFAIIISILFGLSGLLAFSMDLFSLICLHLNWFYLLASKLFHWHLNINLSLFNLFIGM
ncbi:Gpi1-domain-containing protein [Neoconidiobolus thromboides FSU 785]|nr:Gpi1-domain-containing protein [Neoconidiobolus thromboides FSU 785]